MKTPAAAGTLPIKATTQGKLVATVRLPRGDDVLAACGQLKSIKKGLL